MHCCKITNIKETTTHSIYLIKQYYAMSSAGDNGRFGDASPDVGCVISSASDYYQKPLCVPLGCLQTSRTLHVTVFRLRDPASDPRVSLLSHTAQVLGWLASHRLQRPCRQVLIQVPAHLGWIGLPLGRCGIYSKTQDTFPRLSSFFPKRLILF
jgi:hypothetical protein